MAAARAPQRQGSFSSSRELQPWDYVPPSVLEAEKFLRAAHEVEHQRPRVAYLCRLHAIEMVHRMDPTGAGRGVRQFKTALLDRVMQDNERTLELREKGSDVEELQSFYHEYNAAYVSLQDELADREQEMRAYQTAVTLFEVLAAVTQAAQQSIDPKLVEAGKQVAEKAEGYKVYNILPLDSGSDTSAPLLKLPEVVAAIEGLRATEGLRHPHTLEPTLEPGVGGPEIHTSSNLQLPSAYSAPLRHGEPVRDLLDWLHLVFGFQRDNVANQREHLILLLANAHVRLKDPRPEPLHRLDARAVQEVLDRLLSNYRKWCHFLRFKSVMRDMPEDPELRKQHQLLLTGLYLLIWGEAANLRFTPECLCYIFHHMAGEMTALKSTEKSTVREAFHLLPGYGREVDGFLTYIVTPIYSVMAQGGDGREGRPVCLPAFCHGRREQEAQNSCNGTAPHSEWRNYDDFNEYFWSPSCLKLGWPPNLSCSFFATGVSSRRKRSSTVSPVWPRPVPEKENPRGRPARRGSMGPPTGTAKVGFVEHRTVLHLFRDFNRLWTFYVVALQFMVIIAWEGPWYGVFSNQGTLQRSLSIFITIAGMGLLQAVVDLVLSVGLFRTSHWTTSLRLVLRVPYYAAWTVVLALCYALMWSPNSTSQGLVRSIQTWVGAKWNNPNLYYFAIILYLLPHALNLLLWALPCILRWAQNTNWSFFRFLFWWSNPSNYVGRGMQENQLTISGYTIFWLALLAAKLAFSYHFQIEPLIEPTKLIIGATVEYRVHQIIPSDQNILAVIAVWVPIILVYVMDMQIWYAIFSTVVGGVTGAFQRLGEIRTLSMLRSRFRSVPGAFNEQLLPAQPNLKSSFSLSRSFKEPGKDTKEAAKFAQLWNEVISSFREEDLISNKEKDLLMVPYASGGSPVVQWPPFLLANKVPHAVQMAAKEAQQAQGQGHQPRDSEVWYKISSDYYMQCAVRETFATLESLLRTIVVGASDIIVVDGILEEVQRLQAGGMLMSGLRMKALPALFRTVCELADLLAEGKEESRGAVVRALQDMFEIFTKDLLTLNARDAMLSAPSGPLQDDRVAQLFAAPESLLFPPPPSAAWVEKARRFQILVSVHKGGASEVPTNLEARRRINFFANSLFMHMPAAPRVRLMQSFSVLTPYYSEDVLYGAEQIRAENEDGVSILFYLQKIYPDEWANFLERMGCRSEEQVWGLPSGAQALREWTSNRGQTLWRTVRGMMYYQRAIQLQAFLDVCSDQEFAAGYQAVQQGGREGNKSHLKTWRQIEAVSALKFTYVAACQVYGQQKRAGDPKAADIADLMRNNEALRVAYVDEVELDRLDSEEARWGPPSKAYYSVLVKASQGEEQEVYRIRLPGNPKLGEGKPENQNAALIFTRGDALQAIDMNQDSYLEEAFKMRNLLQELLNEPGVAAVQCCKGCKQRAPTILGVREHIFTGSVSSLAWFMSLQDSSFVTIGQRVLAWPLRVRFHYGHPDVFDRLFHITQGGMSKASKGINLSEDIYAGFNSTLRRGRVSHHEYMTLGKGRDVGLNQISLFEAKVSNGNGEQTLSRDVYRLGSNFDFFRMLSLYFTTVGFYVNSVVVVLTVFAFLYGRVYLSLTGVADSLADYAQVSGSTGLQAALGSQALVQLGLLMALPMVMEMGLELGFRRAALDFVVMQIQLASVFFTFSLGTRSHYFARAIAHGGAKYRATGRGFVVRHERFAENYRVFSRSHFAPAIEILLMLIIVTVWGSSLYVSGPGYVFLTFSMWFLCLSWLFGPFLFNPSGFEWQKAVEDWEDWVKWMTAQGGVGVGGDKCWESWWEEEQEHLRTTGLMGRLFELVLALRFLIYQYGIVYNLNVTSSNQSALVYAYSWAAVLGLLLTLRIVAFAGRRMSADFQLLFRLLKAVAFVAAVGALTAVFVLTSFTFGDLMASLLAFLPTGWFIITIAQCLRPIVAFIGFWDTVKRLAFFYDYFFGIIIFFPIAVLSWLPFVSDFQTRLLFNTAFSRGLQISRILAGKKT